MRPLTDAFACFPSLPATCTQAATRLANGLYAAALAEASAMSAVGGDVEAVWSPALLAPGDCQPWRLGLALGLLDTACRRGGWREVMCRACHSRDPFIAAVFGMGLGLHLQPPSARLASWLFAPRDDGSSHYGMVPELYLRVQSIAARWARKTNGMTETPDNEVFAGGARGH